MEFVGLDEVAHEATQTLPVYHRKLLMVAGALATQPKMLLMDEPVGGLNPQEIDDVMALVRRLKERGLTIMLIEHVMRFLVRLSDRVLIMHHGEKIFEGSASGLVYDKTVVDVYLGEGSSRRLRHLLEDRPVARRGRSKCSREQPVSENMSDAAPGSRLARRRLSRPARAARHLVRGAGRRPHHHHRPQRPRQDHAAAGRLRPDPPDGGRDSLRRQGARPGAGRPDRGARHSAHSAGRHDLLGDDGARQSPHGRLPARALQPGRREASRRSMRCCPGSRSGRARLASTLSGGERRMLADRARDDDGRADSVDRRAFAGPRPHRDRHHLRLDPGPERGGTDNPAGGGEREPRRRSRGSHLSARPRSNSSGRAPPASWTCTRRSSRPISGPEAARWKPSFRSSSVGSPSAPCTPRAPSGSRWCGGRWACSTWRTARYSPSAATLPIRRSSNWACPGTSACRRR